MKNVFSYLLYDTIYMENSSLNWKFFKHLYILDEAISANLMINKEIVGFAVKN